MCVLLFSLDFAHLGIWSQHAVAMHSALSCKHAAPVCDEAPESLGVKEDGTPTGWITTATAVRILDDISQCAEVRIEPHASILIACCQIV